MNLKQHSDLDIQRRWDELMVKPVVKQRVCLKCKKKFKSQHTGQRMCLSCKQGKMQRSKLAEEVVVLV